MKIQSSELSGRVLDWAAAKAAGHNVDGIAAQMASHIENWESREVTPIPKQHIRPYCEWFWAGCYLGPQGQRLAIPEFHRNANLVEPFVEELGIATHPDYVSIRKTGGTPACIGRMTPKVLTSAVARRHAKRP
jgi:hypothetical protein